LVRAEAKDAESLGAALELLEAAVARDSIFDEARVAFARGCLEMFRATDERSWLESGIAELETVSKADPPAVRGLVTLAALRRALGDDDGELATLERSVGDYPHHGELRRRYANALARSGDIDEAERQYQRAIYLQPGFWPNHYYMAELHRARGNFDAAANEYRRVVELAPLYVGGYLNLGVVYTNLGREELAREVFEQSIEVESKDNYVAFSNLGNLYYNQRRFADAAAMFERALEISDGDYIVWGNLGATLNFVEGPARAEGPYRRALELAESSRAENPADPHVLCDIAGFHAALGEREAGLEAVAAAESLEPSNVLTMAAIAEAYEDLDDRERALEWVGRALRAGAPRSEFEGNPTLRDLVADERYRRLVSESGESQ
jgi:serine/threonine-protein kinase